MAMASTPGEGSVPIRRAVGRRAHLTSITGGVPAGAAAGWVGVSDLVRAIGPRVAASTKRQALSVVA
jgi:hypothetical protein